MPPAIHASLSPTRVEELALEAFWTTEPCGLCTACGAEVRGIDPERERAPCGACGARRVYGAQRLVFLLMESLP